LIVALFLELSTKMECNICLQPLNPQFNKPTICGHYFHKNCLCAWLNSTRHLPQAPTCPTCRGDITFERAIIDYYHIGYMKTKKIQNMDGDYFFYPNGQLKYFLDIDRKTDLITGGYAIDKKQTHKKEITTEFISQHYPKLELQRNDESYNIWDEL